MVLLEGHEDTYKVAQGCWVRWLGAVRGAGPQLPASSRLSRQTQLFPHPSPYPAGAAGAGASDCCHMVLMCTQRLGMHSPAGMFAPGGCTASGGPSTLQPSAPFCKEQDGGHQVPAEGMGPHCCLPHA